MFFEARELRTDNEWEIIDTQIIIGILTNEQIDNMIWFKATIRRGDYEYRRHIPNYIKDWAKPEQLVNS